MIKPSHSALAIPANFLKNSVLPYNGFWKTNSVSHCVHILDDFLSMGPPRFSRCYSSLMAFYTLAKDIGLSIRAEKTVYPTTTLTFLGLELDTIKFEVRLPDDKLQRLKSEIQKFQNRSSASLRELQSFIGLLNFVCKVVPQDVLSYDAL
jgi:hypothetical protein